MNKKKLITILLIPILSFIALLTFISPIRAAIFEKGDYVLEQADVIEDNLYISEAETIDISGVLDGDLFAATGTINISGTVTGNVYILANSVNIPGNVYGNSYIAAQSVDLSGTLSRDVKVLAMFSDISATIGKDVLVIASTSNISGRMNDDVRVIANNSNITGNVTGESLIFANSSIINDDLIEGEIYENIFEKEVREPKIETEGIRNWFRGIFFGVNVFSVISGFLGMYLVGVILIYLAPVKTLKIEEKIIGSLQEFIFSFLIGLLILAIAPLTVLVLLFTFIGAPLALLITALIIFAMTLGTIWVESAIGYKILSQANKDDNQRLLSLLIGRALTTVVNFVPIVRFFYKSILSTVAIGALVRFKYDGISEARKSTSKRKITKKKKAEK